jgi:flagellar biosynthetic protein FliQ
VHDLLTRTLTEGIYLALWVSVPVLAVSFLVSLLVGLGQSFTQLTEPALNNIPRALAVMFALALSGGWMAQQLGSFTGRLLSALPDLVR